MNALGLGHVQLVAEEEGGGMDLRCQYVGQRLAHQARPAHHQHPLARHIDLIVGQQVHDGRRGDGHGRYAVTHGSTGSS